jgi:hypothetical protein
VIEPTKQKVGPDCKIVLWYCLGATAMPAHLTEYDLTAIAEEIHSDEARREGRSMDDIMTQVGLYRQMGCSSYVHSSITGISRVEWNR